MNIQNNSRYHDVHARSLADPEGFWAEAAREIDWIEPAKKIFDPSMGAYGRWFAGAVVNTCYNALDRHVAGGRADQVALIHDSPLAGAVTKFTYAEMLREVQTLAAIMQDFGDDALFGQPLNPIVKHDPLIVPGDDPARLLENLRRRIGTFRQHVAYRIVELEHGEMSLRDQ